MSLEKCRYNSFENNNNNHNHNNNNYSLLAKSGFFKHHRDDDDDDVIKCYNCSFEFKIINHHNNKEEDIAVVVPRLHDEQYNECKTIKDRLLSYNRNNSNGATSKFLCLESLHFEKERLKTFVDWPIPRVISPEKLANGGFYYTRDKDYCCCIFCNVIIGNWERGDTPREKHDRQCGFKNEQPVGNINLEANAILDKLVLDGEEAPLALMFNERQLPYHHEEKKFGVMLHTKPYEKNYNLLSWRVFTFYHHKNNFPSKRISQTPEEMAEAGFMYANMSDHVVCFHCGIGLRNWQFDNVPWEEHARHNPYCAYVMSIKGQEFIDKIRREKPLYDIRSKYVVKTPGRNKYFKDISEEDLDILMNTLDIMKSFDKDNFPGLRYLFRNRLLLTGRPFPSRSMCINFYNRELKYISVRDCIQPNYNKLLSKMKKNHNNNNNKKNNNNNISSKYSSTATTTTKKCQRCKDFLIHEVYIPCCHLILKCKNCPPRQQKTTKEKGVCSYCYQNIKGIINPIVVLLPPPTTTATTTTTTRLQ